MFNDICLQWKNISSGSHLGNVITLWKKNGSMYSSTSKMIGEIQGWAFRQITNSSVELTVCRTGSSQLQTRLINNGLIWQEMSTKLNARRD
jgi:hypothetical protein